MIKKGQYKVRKVCRLCNSKNLHQFMDLGWMPHAGDFLEKSDLGKEKHYPLKVYFCKNCTLVQVLHIIDPDTLFKDYRYLSSIGLKDHFRDYAQIVFNRFLKRNDFVVEIGSNDGVLLSPLSKLGVNVLGVDPAENVAQIAKRKGLSTMVDYFDEDIAKKILKKHGTADAIFANNVLAHIDNLRGVFTGIRKLLKKDGVLVFEVHYLPLLIKNLQYDFFYNEHLSYYTLLSLKSFVESFGFDIFDVVQIPIHSGSVRVFVKNKNNKKIKVKDSVEKLVISEKQNGYKKLSKFSNFGNKVGEHKNNLRIELKKLRSEGKRLVGYGAAGRGNTLLNYCGIDFQLLEYIVDESPERYGRYTPGTHIPIVPPEVFRNNHPDYTLIIAWSYAEAIVEKEDGFRKKGGKFIVPLPKLKIM